MKVVFALCVTLASVYLVAGAVQHPYDFETQPWINAYELFDVTPESKPIEIKRAYRKLAMVYHPDKAADDAQKDLFERIWPHYVFANEVLENVEQKRRYDHLLEIGKTRITNEDIENSWSKTKNMWTSDIGWAPFTSDQALWLCIIGTAACVLIPFYNYYDAKAKKAKKLSDAREAEKKQLLERTKNVSEKNKKADDERAQKAAAKAARQTVQTKTEYEQPDETPASQKDAEEQAQKAKEREKALEKKKKEELRFANAKTKVKQYFRILASNTGRFFNNFAPASVVGNKLRLTVDDVEATLLKKLKEPQIVSLSEALVATFPGFTINDAVAIEKQGKDLSPEQLYKGMTRFEVAFSTVNAEFVLTSSLVSQYQQKQDALKASQEESDDEDEVEQKGKSSGKKSAAAPAASASPVSSSSAAAARGVAAPAPNADGGVWTNEQQQQLQKALADVPKNANDRWKQIAKRVSGKNESDCEARFKYIKELIKNQSFLD